MGLYLNPGNDMFKMSLNSEIYVDKSGLIEYTNKVLDSEQKYICVSRPRRFGKSMTAKMLMAYYDKSCDSYGLFKNLKISKKGSFEKHLNKYPVLHLDIQWFRSNADNGEKALLLFQKEVISELRKAYPDCVGIDDSYLPLVLAKINVTTGDRFIIIIDEWDCLFREDKNDIKVQEEYIVLLRGLFKGNQADRFVKLAYLTGILPIKKYGTQSALNNFREFTMVNPGALAEYVGFTEEEVYSLCEKYNMDFQETKNWYDGYRFRKVKSIYNPKSVVEAMLNEDFDSYWSNTETYESLKMYIDMNFDGLKDSIVTMLGNGSCKINSRFFQNDMTSFESKDDVLTLLVHLGYLGYDADTEEVFIPNQEIANEFKNAVEGSGWSKIASALEKSDELLEATISGNAEFVAKSISDIHSESTSVLSYNNENSLSCVISIAYYSARKYYTLIREFPTGKGFADIVFLPRKNTDKPAIIVELKWDLSAEGAIEQIKSKNYVSAFDDYDGDIVLVGINYDKTTKEHSCIIEKGKIV